jgi:hypothetical protein
MLGRNIMNRRTTLTLTTKALLFLAVVSATALPQIGFAQSKSSAGTWKLNLAKSKYSPGPPPRSSTLTYQVEGQSLTATTEGIDAQGNPTKVVHGPYVYDGKSYPVTGARAYDAASYKIINDSTDEITRTKMGKVVQTVTEVLSEDGKTLTFTTTGVNANGQQINNTAVYEKQ